MQAWHWRMAAALVVAGLTGTAFAADTQITTLTIEEESGVDRVNEPMTMGVPFPKGMVTDLAKVAVLDESGKALDCQWSKAANWVNDPSIKWAHLTLPVPIKAKGKKVLTLMLKDAAVPAPKTPLTAEVKDNVATVVTGPVKFVVRGAKFDGFTEAWFDPSGKGDFSDANKVIDTKDARGSLVQADGKSFRSSNDPDGTVEIERQGPMEVVIKATGVHKDADGEKRFDYVVRFYAYANSPVVRVSHTFENRQGSKETDYLRMSLLAFRIHTTLGGGTVTIGSEEEPLTTPGQGAITQVSSDKFVVTSGEKQLGTGKGKSTKPLTTGWIDLTKDGKGVALGLKWFWQMYPKAMTVDGRGVIGANLYQVCDDETTPDWHKDPFDVYMGQSRTHYLTVKFHGRESAASLNDFFAGTQRPLMAWASPKYYCRDTHAFGYAAESDPSLYGERAGDVQAYDAKLKQSIERILKKRDGHTYTHYRDSYGFYEWGDVFHWGWKDFGKSPKKTPEWLVSWEGNYYDYPNAALMQFVRTGDKTYLEGFIPSAIHVGDVFTCHYYEGRPQLAGACRYCPPRNHVAIDNGTPYISVEYNHNKSQCVFNHYYLTGDLRSLNNAKLLSNNALNNHAADSGWAARGVGHQLAALWCAYELTGEKQYFDRMKGMADRAMRQFRNGRYSKGGRFMWGIANEGLVYYYWVSRDQRVIDVLKQGLDKMGGRAANYTNMALGNAMVYAMTKDPKYADLAWRAFGRSGMQHRPKGFGLAWRNTPFALYFLSTDLKEFNRDAPKP